MALPALLPEIQFIQRVQRGGAAVGAKSGLIDFSHIKAALFFRPSTDEESREHQPG
jgi:hypothetical protein